MYVGTDELEIKVAEKIMKMCPHVDMLRFSNSGTEATLHTMRFARSYTGRSKIIKFEGHYHGWHDYAMLSNLGAHPGGPEVAPYNVPSTWGIPDETMKTMIVLPWNNLEVLEKTIRSRAGEIAAVITEPIMMNIGCVPPREGYLKAMQQLCEENGIVFILDEVISGFRLAPGGAAEYYGLQPDLVTYAKALGAGVPVSAIGGKRKIMKDVVPGKILHAGTYDGNPLVMAAALAALNTLSANDNAAYKHLNKLARMLREGLDDAVARLHAPALYQNVGAVGGQLYFTKLKEINDYREYFQVDTSIFPRYHKELMKRGIYLHPLQSEHEFISAVHTEQDIEKHVAASTEALKVMA